ncbi:MAG: hypothetical protein WBG65_03020 [Sulfurimonadaceae bacterium]
MIKNKILAALLLGAMVLFSGCAPKASKDAVVVHKVQIINMHTGNVEVNAHSNGDYITDEDLAKAIEESILENKLFEQVVHESKENYLLEVAVVSMDKPSMGFTMTVSMEATWLLKDLSNNKIIMRKVIHSSSTKTVGDAFVGVERIKIAIEGAIHENIRLGLLDISKIQF